MKRLLIAAVITLLLPITAFAQSADVWFPTGGGPKYLKPVVNTWGLLIPGVATSSNGCLAITASGWIYPTGSPCGGAGSGSSFSTTSADFWKTQRNFFSTTSADWWKTQNNFFSTTSADAFLAQRNLFSTTSSDYWKTQTNFFSTTSAIFFLSTQTLFSTTSADYWQGQRNFFSTTSASYFLAQNQGAAFSTTSAIYFVHSSTTIPKTYTANTYSNALQTIPYASTTAVTASYASSTAWFGGGLLSTCASGNFLTWTGGRFGCAADQTGSGGGMFDWTPTSNFGELANATGTPIWFQAGLQSSSTAIFDMDDADPVDIYANDGQSFISLINKDLSKTWLLNAAGNDLRLADVTASIFKERFAFTATGNFGIATTGPQTALGVQGNVFVAGHITSTSTLRNVFPFASTTAISTSYASSTVYFGAGLADCNTGNMLTWTAGRFGCEDDTTGGGGGFAFPFTTSIFGSTVANATTTLMGFTTGLYALASSTIGDGSQQGGLTISGGATTTGVLRVPAGTNGQPAIAFITAPQTGLYLTNSRLTVRVGTVVSAEGADTTNGGAWGVGNGNAATWPSLYDLSDLQHNTGIDFPGNDDIYFDTNGSRRMYLDKWGQLYVGAAATPAAMFQAATSTANATTSVVLGRTGQNKGTCLTMYRSNGSVVYLYIPGNATAFTISTTKGAGCVDN